MTRVAVVGAGIVGLSAARALADRGADVVVLERDQPGSGQSAGRVRVFRHVHADGSLVPLAVEARAGWRAWEERFGQPLLGDEGVLFTGPEVAERASHLAAAGVPHRLVGQDEQRSLLPIAEPQGETALLDEIGGVMRARDAIDALAQDLRIEKADVRSVNELPFDQVLVCAGVGTPALAKPLGIDIPLDVRPHIRATYPLREPSVSPLPCLLDRSGVHGDPVYSSPVEELGAYAVGLAVDEPGVDDGGERSLAALRRYVGRGLPGVVPEPLELRPCQVSLLPWSPDAFAAWQAGRATFFAGHNLFKFAPVLGPLLADAVLEGRLPPLLAPPA